MAKRKKVPELKATKINPGAGELLISSKLAQATVEYLTTRPYRETYQLIGAFQQSAQAQAQARQASEQVEAKEAEAGA